MPIIKTVGGRYEVSEEIGRGGMQSVHDAFDTRLRRRVAIKTPLGTSAVKRFASSAQLSARVRHPNVASALDYFVDNGSAFFVEELIQGLNLQQCFDNHFPRLCADSTAKVLHHLAKGVAASHRVDVIHRDLKPSNVMVSVNLSFSSIKITDFGIAKLAESQIDSDLKEIEKADKSNVSSTLLGAIPFMAPEALAKGNGGSASKAIDVWALGAMTYWMLTGKHPYGNGITAVTGIMSGKPPTRPDDKIFFGATRELVEALWEIIQKCMSTNQNNRPTADALSSKCAELLYLEGPRVISTVTNKHQSSQIWFATTDEGTLAIPRVEFIEGKPDPQVRVSSFSFSGSPNPRGVAAIVLK